MRLLRYSACLQLKPTESFGLREFAKPCKASYLCTSDGVLVFCFTPVLPTAGSSRQSGRLAIPLIVAWLDPAEAPRTCSFVMAVLVRMEHNVALPSKWSTSNIEYSVHSYTLLRPTYSTRPTNLQRISVSVSNRTRSRKREKTPTKSYRHRPKRKKFVNRNVQSHKFVLQAFKLPSF